MFRWHSNSKGKVLVKQCQDLGARQLLLVHFRARIHPCTMYSRDHNFSSILCEEFLYGFNITGETTKTTGGNQNVQSTSVVPDSQLRTFSSDTSIFSCILHFARNTMTSSLTHKHCTSFQRISQSSGNVIRIPKRKNETIKLLIKS